MHVLADGVGIRHEREKVRHDGAPVLDGIADRVLHEAICDENPERREIARNRRDPDRRAVDFRREAIPAEDPDAEERRFEEERRQRFECERRAEDVAHEARIL